jgi:dTDP-4-amino-4,6-dideoxygalactose transaminase
MGVHVPYIDYSMIPDDLKKEILIEIGRIMRFKNSGEHEQYVTDVEARLSEYFQTKFAVAVDSGTTALQLSLTALGVREGDEVIIPTYTYVATALAVTNLGAKPVFIDVKMNDLTINPDLIESNITSRTKAVIPVHIHGLCCDMDKIRRICEKRRIALVEDASQSHGACINGKKAGTFGIGCFSLHTSKNLGGIGDAGFIALNDEDLYRKIQGLLVPDSGTKAALETRRTPCTMDAIQAAIVQKKLAFLDIVNKRKREIASQYDSFIVDSDIMKPVALQGTYPVYRDYFILVDDRDALKACLLKEGIETKLGYTPLHLSKTFESFWGSKINFPVSETIAGRVLLLPSFWGMTDSQLKHVCAIMRAFFS